MAVYVVAQGQIVNQAKLDEYMSKSGATLAGLEFKVLAVDTAAEVVEGDINPPRVVLIEFPDKATFREWYDAPAYQDIVGLRLEGVEGTLVVANGL